MDIVQSRFISLKKAALTPSGIAAASVIIMANDVFIQSINSPSCQIV